MESLSFSSTWIFVCLHRGNTTRSAHMQLRWRIAQWDYLESLTDFQHLLEETSVNSLLPVFRPLGVRLVASGMKRSRTFLKQSAAEQIACKLYFVFSVRSYSEGVCFFIFYFCGYQISCSTSHKNSPSNQPRRIRWSFWKCYSQCWEDNYYHQAVRPSSFSIYCKGSISWQPVHKKSEGLRRTMGSHVGTQGNVCVELIQSWPVNLPTVWRLIIIHKFTWHWSVTLNYCNPGQ